MKRAELYALVWEKPMVHVAKHFGIFDVGLRKFCVKHDIPTPPLGYWAKLAYGKKVVQPPLPPLKSDSLAIVTEYVKEGLVESICFVSTENLIITITSGFRFSVHTTAP